MSDLYFGFDTERLLLRFDARGGAVREQLAELDTLRVVFLQPEGFELTISNPSSKRPLLQLYHNDVPVAESGIEASRAAKNPRIMRRSMGLVVAYLS